MSKRAPKCFVNDMAGGGVFVCRRPVATANGFCAFHGAQTILNCKLELTWREWLRANVVRRPRNLWRALLHLPTKIRYLWVIAQHPKCSVSDCQDHAMSRDGGKCIDHHVESLGAW